jgi:hypothetical protein
MPEFLVYFAPLLFRVKTVCKKLLTLLLDHAKYFNEGSHTSRLLSTGKIDRAGGGGVLELCEGHKEVRDLAFLGAAEFHLSNRNEELEDLVELVGVEVDVVFVVE